MQIINYLEPQMASANVYGSLTVDEMLKKQRSQRYKHSQKQTSSAISLKKTGSLCVSFLEVLAYFLLKIRWGYLLCVVLLVTWAGVLNLTEAIFSRTNTISLNNLSTTNTSLLMTQMRNFISAEPDDAFDADGNLVLTELMNTVFVKPVKYSNYTVKSGDTISSVSKRFGLTNISTLISANAIENVRRLYVGDTLRIPSIDGVVHTVQQGDSLSFLSKKYAVTLEELLDVNNLKSTQIAIGDSLFIPGVALDSNSLKKALGELFSLPVKANYRITSPYGYRADPFTGVRSFHTGIDMAAPTGTAIRAAMSGTVVASSYSSLYGNYVILRHLNGYQTLYAHLSSNNVRVGQSIQQGQRLGGLGSTGYSTGPHLHFSVYKNGKLVNPTTVLQF
ncbi:MAG TPA: M23 family metallopeptidase [Treponemataceae bacterium]|nr:M23 family metallopeptidase [Treponemataceae bacterium]